MADHARPLRTSRGLFSPADLVSIDESFTGGVTRSGEEKLMLAVLRDAVGCFQENALSEYPWQQKLFQQVQDWILDKNQKWFFSFENICETLELDPDYIRRGLHAWKKAQHTRSDPKNFNNFEPIPKSRSGNITHSKIAYSTEAIPMLFRDHPLISHRGIHSWPPAWTWIGGMQNQSPQGEIGILREVHTSKIQPNNRCFLRVYY